MNTSIFTIIMNLYPDILANIIIQKYLLNVRCLIIFTDKENIFNYFGNIPTVKIEAEAGYIQRERVFQYFGCQGIILKTNKPSLALRKFENEIRFNKERYNNRKYLFIPGNNMLEDSGYIFSQKEIKYISDILVIEEVKRQQATQTFLPTRYSKFFLWTHKYVGTEYHSEKILLDVWFSKNQSFSSNSNLYPNKLANQLGRVLEMATFQYEPYTIIGPTINQYKGSEMMTALMFAKYYNMTPVPVVNPEDYWGKIFQNWSGNGLLGNLAEDKADIGFAALYTWEEEYRFLDLSKPLVRTGITCLVPAPRLAAGWPTLIFAYSSTMWLAVGISFFICILSHFFLHYFYRKINLRNSDRVPRMSKRNMLGKSAFSIIKLFVLQVVTNSEIPNGTNGKYFMGLLFTLSLLLTSTYSSGLSSIMTIPRYETPVNTVKEFAQSGIYWGATQDAWTKSIENVEDPMYKEITRRFIPTSEEKLRDYSFSSDFAFPLERLPMKNYAIGSYIRKDVIGNFHLMHEDFYWEHCVMMTRKSSILLPLLDMFILRVFETGLVSYWQNEATSLYMDAHVQRAVRYYYYNHKTGNIVIKLKWIHVEGAFGILCIGHSISSFAFLVELFYHYFKR